MSKRYRKYVSARDGRSRKRGKARQGHHGASLLFSVRADEGGVSRATSPIGSLLAAAATVAAPPLLNGRGIGLPSVRVNASRRELHGPVAIAGHSRERLTLGQIGPKAASRLSLSSSSYPPTRGIGQVLDLSTAERPIARLDTAERTRLNSLLSKNVNGRASRFVWLRQFEVGNNSADANCLLNRLDFRQTRRRSPVQSGPNPMSCRLSGILKNRVF